jgi:outer membrane protein assembly factor BamB
MAPSNQSIHYTNLGGKALGLKPCRPTTGSLQGRPGQVRIPSGGPKENTVRTHSTARVPRLFRILCLAAALAASRGEASPPRLVASGEPGWPQWRGPRRDGICLEKGLLQEWPEGGPGVVWTAGGLGSGYSSPIITGGRIYITGEVKDDLLIHALDESGKLIWTAKNGRSWRGPYPGARACCACSEGRVYHMNGHGRVVCIDAATGREIWAVEALERFDGRTPTWGIGECLLVTGEKVGGKVIVTPGGRKGAMAALDKLTGETVWASEPVALEAPSGAGDEPQGPSGLDFDTASYASPILFELGGRQLIAGCSSRHVLGVDAGTGHILWKRPLPSTYKVLALTPVLCEDGVFMSAPDSGGGRLYRFIGGEPEPRVEEAWTSDIDTCHGGVLLVGGILLGSWYRHYNGWGCVDARTGKTLHRTDEIEMGSAVHADGRFYCLSQSGVMALVRADAKEFRIVSRFRLPGLRGKDAWPHPVILDGRLYLRYHDTLYCHDIKAPR